MQGPPLAVGGSHWIWTLLATGAKLQVDLHAGQPPRRARHVHNRCTILNYFRTEHRDAGNE